MSDAATATEPVKRSRKNAKATTVRKTKRRNGDPVRVFSDYRIAYWPSGVPGGDPQRKFVTTAESLEEAEAIAEDLRVKLARRRGCGPRALATLDELCRDVIAHLRATGGAEGSIKAYRSNWNCWIPAEVGEVTCIDLRRHHWTAIFDSVNQNGGSVATVTNISRTLGVVLEFGAMRDYFGDGEPFACAHIHRRAVVRTAKATARRIAQQARECDDAPRTAITLEECPSPEDVEEYANAFEVVYPGYGYRLVMLAYATGLRIEELFALQVDDVHVALCEVNVNVQLDRYHQWPATTLPKSKRVRTALMWTWAAPIAQSLVEDAERRTDVDPLVRSDTGWLFPRLTVSDVGWAEYTGKLAKKAIDLCGWGWKFHWLRHTYASRSLAPDSFGGFGLDVTVVQQSLGHASVSTTLNTYVHRQKGDATIVRAKTAVKPGWTL